MIQISSPTVWRRWLALELGRLRREAGLSQREVARACGWSGGVLSDFETATRPVFEDDLGKLLALYGVAEDNRADYYVAAGRASGRDSPAERYERVLSDHLSLLVGLELGASAIQTYESGAVPGLLQTPAYAEAILRRYAWPRTDLEIARLVELRIERQTILLRREPIDLSVILDEAALRHVARDRTVMAEQLEYLCEAAGLPNVAIRVVPLEQSAPSHSQTHFTVFDLAWLADPLLAYVELRDQASWVEEPRDVKGYALAFQSLWQLATEESESATLMHTIAREFWQ